MTRDAGYTLVEVMIGVALAVFLISAAVMAFLGAGVISSLAKHRIEALEVVRSRVEQLKVTSFDAIADGSSSVSFDAGDDGVFGNADDRQGTLTVTVQDFLDMDADGNTAETSIDIDGGGNDPTAAKPVRVTFTWSEKVLGQLTNVSVFIDTLISA